MNLKRILPTLAIAAAATASMSAHAGYVVLDAWQLALPGMNTTTNIGYLNVNGGGATVQQQINGSGNLFSGALFQESGSIYTLSYTANNVVGAGDTGPALNLPEQLYISFSAISGFLTTALPGGGYNYVITGGTYDIGVVVGGVDGPVLAGGSIVGLGGSIGNTSIIGGIAGQTTVLGTILGSVSGFDVLDSTGTSLLPEMATGKVLFEPTTNNTLTSTGGTATCSFNSSLTCESLGVTSGGQVYLTQVVPEPASLALVGLGLVGAASISRRKAKKQA